MSDFASIAQPHGPDVHLSPLQQYQDNCTNQIHFPCYHCDKPTVITALWSLHGQLNDDILRGPYYPTESFQEYVARTQESIWAFCSLRDLVKAVHYNISRSGYLIFLRAGQNELGRVQEECQPGDNPGDDEDGARGEDIGSGLRGRGEVGPCGTLRVQSLTFHTDGTEQWRPQQTGCRRRRRAIWTV